MDWQTILAGAWAALNSPAGVALVAGLVLWLLNRLYAKRPAWEQYEGAIIAAVKFAEKQIPDDVPNKGLARLDAALKYVAGVFEDVNGRRPNAREEAALREGVQITHASLEAADAL
ncbi:MAG TPA: hypothetical protein VMY69_01900 [Phycisphaerae bacterium]|nr:hypothetical protein [Phycisphaerae bacterium]